MVPTAGSRPRRRRALIGHDGRAATPEEAFWSIVVAAAAQHSIATAAPIPIDPYLTALAINP